MHLAPADGRSTFPDTRSGFVGSIWLIVSALILLAMPIWQQHWWPITDVSWLITVCEKILAGQRLYVDVIETNPPFSVWLYMPPVVAAKGFSVAPETAVFLWVVLLVALGNGLAAQVVLRSGLLSRDHLKKLTPMVLALTLLWPANAFGEREHMATALFLPMVALVAWRASETARSKPSISLAIVVGLCASVLLLVKPYYAVVPLTLSLYLTWRRRDLRSFFTPENWTMGFICIGYLGAVWLAYPAFLTVIYPVLQDTYMQHTTRAIVALVYLPSFALIALVLRLLFTQTAFQRLLEVLLIASAAACLPLFYQGKGWSYHAYPAIAFALIALSLLVLTPVKAEPFSVRKAVLLGAMTIGLFLSWRPFQPTEKPEPDLLQQIETALPGVRRVAVLGTDIATGNIINRMIGGEWIGHYCSDWLGGMAVLLADHARGIGDLAIEAKYRNMMGAYRNAKLQELVEANPTLVLVQQFDPVWGPYWRADGRFQIFLQDYQVLGESKDLVAYGLMD